MPVSREIVYSVVDNTKKGLTSIDRNLKRAERSATGLGGSSKRLGIALGGVAGIATGLATTIGAQLVGKTIDAAKQVDNLANISRFGAEQIQAVGIVAERSGGSIEDVADASREMQLRLAEAATLGTGPAVDALDLLGVSIRDLQQLRPEEQFAVLRDRLSEIEDPARRAFLAEELLGGASERLAETIALTSTEFDRQVDAAKASGRVLSGDAVAGATQAGEAMDDAIGSVKGLATELIAGLAPAITAGANALGTLTQSLSAARAEQARIEPHLENANRLLDEQTDRTGSAGVGWSHLRNRQTEVITTATELADAYERATTQTSSLQLVTEAYHRSLADSETAAETARVHALADAQDRLAIAYQNAFAAQALGRSTTARPGQQTIGGSGETVSTRTDPTRNLRYELDQLRRNNLAALDQVTESVTEGAKATTTAVDEIAHTTNQRLLEQLDTLYANNSISENQYQALTTSTDLQSTLNSLVQGASDAELRALDQVRATGYRSGELTIQGSRMIVSAIQQLNLQRRNARNRGGPTELSNADEFGIDGRVFTRGNRIVAVSGANRVGTSFGPEDAAILDDLAGPDASPAERARIRNTPEYRRRAGEFDPTVPRMASGGIVMGPTLAVVGERGPEAIIPLSRGRQQSQVINLNLDGARLAQWVVGEVNAGIRRGDVLVRGGL